MRKIELPEELKDHLEEVGAEKTPVNQSQLPNIANQSQREIAEAACDVFGTSRKDPERGMAALLSYGPAGFQLLTAKVIAAYRGAAGPGQVSAFLHQYVRIARRDGAIDWNPDHVPTNGTRRLNAQEIPIELDKALRMRAVDLNCTIRDIVITALEQYLGLKPTIKF